MMLANALLRHEMLRSIRAATEAKSNFLANMSHEIRTPMNAILGIAEIHLHDESLAPHFRDALEKIYSAGDLLLNIINDILDLSKIEAGKLELALARYESASLLHDTTTLNIMRVGSKGIVFEVSVDENLPELLIGDELRIKQVLNNLLSNAFKYTKKGLVKLAVSSEPGKEADDVTLVFVVSDTGTGMTEEQAGKLFDRYSRFNMEAHRTAQGTGLGMSITKNLLNLMNGEISVQSRLHRGTTVTVTLPQKRAGAGVVGKELAAALQNFQRNAKHARRSRMAFEPMPYGTVLIVDDVEANLFVVNGLLSHYGLSVETAMSGFEAIDKVKAGKVYDIVFMDHMMPYMDGMEAVRILRGLGYGRPIVALTANAVVGQSDIFLANGFDDFLSKPIDLRQLNAILIKLVRDRHPPEIVEAARRQYSGMDEQRADATPQAGVDPHLAKIFIRDACKSLAVLEPFCEKQGEYTEEDIRAYVINTHGIKSALAIIGELELSVRAFKLEQAGRARDLIGMAAETPAFLDALRGVIERIRPADDDQSCGTAEEDRAYLQEKLLALKAACVVYDKKAAKAALAAMEQKAWTEPTRRLLETISGQLLHSKFKMIASLVDESAGGKCP
jgi:CheY-like chemotaxis protein/nitrogen-specific signal transduction histidine kinase